MISVGTLAWDDGALTTSSPNGSVRTWRRPADLAAARLAVEPPCTSLELADGRDLLTAAFAVLPFVQAPFPAPVFGDAVSTAARAVFETWRTTEASALRVLRGEPDDYLLFARTTSEGWQVGALTAEPLVLTVRVEDLWRTGGQVKPPARAFRVDVVRDPNAKDDPSAVAAGVVREVLTDVAPDARIFLELARNGGFVLTFRREGLGTES